ncbi:MAG: CPBP family intramembrane metalloprotease [Anaerolineales bacterium]|nr:CPBP family intramembrane metalloprotease [Anaerolineales bacterium]
MNDRSNHRMTWVNTARRHLMGTEGQYQAVVLFYLCVITLSEVVTTMGDAHYGMFFHCVVLVLLLMHSALVYRRILRRFLVLLSLAPLIRILSLSLPLAILGLPVIYWYMVIGGLLFIAAFVGGKITEFKGRRIGWSLRAWPAQLAMGICGFGLGYIEYLILNPGPLAEYVTWEDIITAAFILLVFTGLLEEYIFRGLLQSASMQLLGQRGLVYVAVLFSILHLGYHSFMDLLFVLFVGLLFGWWVWRTHSLLGASLAHGIANISLYVLFPLLLNKSALPVASVQPEQISLSPVATVLTSETPMKELAYPVSEILVDNEDQGFVFSGDDLWLDLTDGFGGSFRWLYASQASPSVVVSWIPSFTGCGMYRVDAFIPSGRGLTESARYVIRHRAGSQELTVDQAKYAGSWAPLGNFTFLSKSPVIVQLSNWTGEDQKLFRWVSFDAIRWKLLKPCS